MDQHQTQQSFQGAMNLATDGALMGAGNPGACSGIAARKNSSGRSLLKWVW